MGSPAADAGRQLPSLRPEMSWQLRALAPPAVVARLSRELSLPPLLAAVLWGRGLGDSATTWLRPALAPSLIPNLSAAAERLEEALKSKRRIVVHGDYDADGICGTAVLTLGLRALGGTVRPFIPNRLEDGYGLHPSRVEEHAQHADLLITVDCGISNAPEIARLKELGVEAIVTDHHRPGGERPDCLVVHPDDHTGASGPAPLTGAGVAYQLLWALHRRLGLADPLEYSDIAALGTIADVAPLIGENRALIREGLERMADSSWPGIRAMVTQNGLSRRPLTARDAAFVLAPRLNAAGRLGEADLGLELIITASQRRARELAAYLDARNLERRRIQDAMLEQALAQADPAAPALVLHDDDWHPGVMGIVASKVLEHYYKPVYIVAQGKGSVRSTPGISAVLGLVRSRDLLERFGGHAQAAGFAIRPANLAKFRERIYGYVSEFPPPRPSVTADALVSPRELDRDMLDAIATLEPYGEGHPAPTLLLSGTVDGARAVGQDGNTLQLRLGGLRGVAWRQGELARSLPSGSTVNMAVSLRENDWQGRKRLEFLAEALRLAEPLPLLAAEEVPSGPPAVHRGPPPESGVTPTDMGKLRTKLGNDELTDETVWLAELPLCDAPLQRTRPVTALFEGSHTIYLDLDEVALQRIEEVALVHPTVHELRQAFVWLSRAAKPPFGKAKSELCRQILCELELIDSRGRLRRSAKRDPYSSDTLIKSLVERYTLLSFVKAYRHLDEAGFAAAARTLFLPPGD